MPGAVPRGEVRPWDRAADPRVAPVQRLLDRWDGPVTVSVGITTHRPGDPPSTTLARADATVYEAKARGRGTVVLADEVVPV